MARRFYVKRRAAHRRYGGPGAFLGETIADAHGLWLTQMLDPKTRTGSARLGTVASEPMPQQAKFIDCLLCDQANILLRHAKLAGKKSGPC